MARPQPISQALRRALRALRIATVFAGGGVCSWIACAPAWAASATDAASRRVLIVLDRPHDSFMHRVSAEVAVLGVTLVTVGPPRANESLGPLESLARRERAVAAIRMLPTRRGVEVWMADETSGRSLLRQAIVDESEEGPNQGLIAVQTAELLRTSLRLDPSQRDAAPLSASATGAAPSKPASGREPQKGSQPNVAGTTSPPGAESAPPAASVASPAEAAPPTPASPSQPSGAAPASGTEPAPGAEQDARSGSRTHAGVEAALGVLYSPGAGDVAVQFWLSTYQTLVGPLVLALDLSGPVRPATLSGPEGSASLGAYLLGGSVRTRLYEIPHLFLATVGVGLAATYLRTEGQTRPPLVGKTQSLWTATGYLRAEGSLELAPWLRVGVGVLCGAAVEKTTLRFAGNDAGTWGLPLLGALAVVDVPWR